MGIKRRRKIHCIGLNLGVGLSAAQADREPVSVKPSAPVEDVPLRTVPISPESRLGKTQPWFLACRHPWVSNGNVGRAAYVIVRLVQDVNAEAAGPQVLVLHDRGGVGTTHGASLSSHGARPAGAAATAPPSVSECLELSHLSVAGGDMPVQADTFASVDAAIKNDICARRIVANRNCELPRRISAPSREGILPLRGFAGIAIAPPAELFISTKLIERCRNKGNHGRRKSVARKESLRRQLAEKVFPSDTVSLPDNCQLRRIPLSTLTSTADSFELRRELLDLFAPSLLDHASFLSTIRQEPHHAADAHRFKRRAPQELLEASQHPSIFCTLEITAPILVSLSW